MQEIRTEFVEANGLCFEVDMCGSGGRLALCLHGFPEHAYSWRHQLPLLAGLGYRAWAPNLRGYGATTRPEGAAHYAMEHLLGDVAGLIDAAHAQETVLIGHDWGGVIAWEFARRKIRPLTKLVVMNAPHPKLFERGIRNFAQLRRSWYIFFFQLPWLPEWVLARNGARAIGDAFYDMATDKSRFPPEVLEVYRRNALLPGALKAMVNYYRAALRGGRSTGKTAEKIDTPALLIWGEEDAALGKELNLGLEEFVSSCTIRYLPKVSHWVQQEAPEEVNAILTVWLIGEAPPAFAAY